MKKLNFLVILLGLSLLTFSCSDDDDDNNPVNQGPDGANYFILNQGNSYTFNYYPRDIDNNNKAKEYDEVFTHAGTESYLGLSTAFKVEVARTNGENDDIYFATEGDNRMLAELQYILPDLSSDEQGFDLPFDQIINIMVPIADNEIENWDIHTEEFNDVGVEILGFEVSISGTLKISGERENIETVTNGSFTTEARKFVITYSFSGTGSAQGLSLPIEFDLTMDFYFADGAGLVKQVFNSKNISIDLGLFGSQAFPVEGFERVVESWTPAQ